MQQTNKQMNSCSCAAQLLIILPIVLQAAATKVQEAATKGSEAGKMTESDLQSLQNRADVITYTVLAEMQHFQQYRVGDFKKYMTSYLQGQIDFYKAVCFKCLFMLKILVNLHVNITNGISLQLA
jgi:WASP-binding domain of Sorting nexin protein